VERLCALLIASTSDESPRGPHTRSCWPCRLTTASAFDSQVPGRSHHCIKALRRIPLVLLSISLSGSGLAVALGKQESENESDSPPRVLPSTLLADSKNERQRAARTKSDEFSSFSSRSRSRTRGEQTNEKNFFYCFLSV
jgi:hypothetical protein